MLTAHRFVPCLWFDDQGEEAAKFYVSVFDRSRIVRIARYGKEGQEVHGGKAGTVLSVELELEGMPFMALNGGPHFKFTEAISFQVMCETQAEVDRYWNALAADPAAGECGWLKDKYGLSWQIVPRVVPEMMADPDPAKAGRAMKALLQMKKLDIAALKKAYAG